MSPNLDRGNWVASHTYIGVVKDMHDDGSIDVVLYRSDGSVLGRASPVCGGPRGFEPCCDRANWRKIKKPRFPLTKSAYIEEIVEFVDAEVKP